MIHLSVTGAKFLFPCLFWFSFYNKPTALILYMWSYKQETWSEFFFLVFQLSLHHVYVAAELRCSSLTRRAACPIPIKLHQDHSTNIALERTDSSCQRYCPTASGNRSLNRLSKSPKGNFKNFSCHSWQGKRHHYAACAILTHSQDRGPASYFQWSQWDCCQWSQRKWVPAPWLRCLMRMIIFPKSTLTARLHCWGCRHHLETAQQIFLPLIKQMVTPTSASGFPAWCQYTVIVDGAEAKVTVEIEVLLQFQYHTFITVSNFFICC